VTVEKIISVNIAIVNVIAAWLLPGVALQVAFERQILKPVYHMIGHT
jgi:hypothetical protein